MDRLRDLTELHYQPGTGRPNMRGRTDGDMMKRYVKITALLLMILALCAPGCKEKLQPRPSSLQGDELVMATALRSHMRNHTTQFAFDYKYIFMSVLGGDPDREFLDFFSDLFSKVMPGSQMKESRYGYQNLPQTRGVWVHFEVLDHKPVSDQEAWVTCRTQEFESKHAAVKYRMQLVEGQWQATSIIRMGDERILQ
jgi:hypothetical protein